MQNKVLNGYLRIQPSCLLTCNGYSEKVLYVNNPAVLLKSQVKSNIVYWLENEALGSVLQYRLWWICDRCGSV